MESVVIVTGGGSGIGRALCKYFSWQGWMVCAADISGKNARETIEEISKEEISKTNTACLSVEVDIRNVEEVKNMIEVCEKRFDHINALVNNAGVTDTMHRTLLELPYQKWHEIISTNITGTFICLKECAAAMKSYGKGNIINITSLLGQRGDTRPGDLPYGVSKGAVEALTEYSAVELKALNINVNSAYPGVMVNTGFFKNIPEKDREKLESPDIMNDLVYVLSCLAPGEITGRSFSVRESRDDLDLQVMFRKYLLEGNE